MGMGTSNGTVTPSSTKTRQKAETQTPELVSPKRNRGKREELGWTLASMVDGRCFRAYVVFWGQQRTYHHTKGLRVKEETACTRLAVLYWVLHGGLMSMRRGLRRAGKL